MKRYSKWVWAGVALTTIGVLAGCGSATNSPSSTTGTNGTSNAMLTTNTTGTASTNTTGPSTNSTSSNPVQSSTNTAASNTTSSNNDTQALVSATVPLTSGNAVPSIKLNVPKGWTKQRVGQGDTSGQSWVNPSDQNQQIQVMVTGNMGAIQNVNTGKWDVTGIFGKGTAGMSWSNVSPDKLTGDFVDTRKMNYYAKNEQTPYTGYGRAFIVKKPNPFAVYVEVWGSNHLANSILNTVLLQQSN